VCNERLLDSSRLRRVANYESGCVRDLAGEACDEAAKHHQTREISLPLNVAKTLAKT
jgi:hypothetical protein